AENVMDIRKVDPDKRALLLAGNRRGAFVPVKEQIAPTVWVTRYVDAFCPRCFSAIRLPDQVLGSRSTILPLVKSGDPSRAKDNPQDHATWPCDRRRLVDDLWALGLANLPTLRKYDARAAGCAELVGRDLDRWRMILAVALWLEERHGLQGLFQRMTNVAEVCQQERAQTDGADAKVRVLILALQRFLAGRGSVEFETSQLADVMNEVAQAEGL